MAREVNLNADMGESFGKYRIGDDDGILEVIQSASIACGMHGGDPRVMAEAVDKAKARGVSIGAHPGFDDLWGFGRRRIMMDTKDLEYLVIYQIGALYAIAESRGAKVTHVKPHGAMNNMACEDNAYARALAGAVKAFDSDLIFVTVALSELAKEGEKQGLKVAMEGFADRTYDDSGMLTSRADPTAVIKDPDQAKDQVFRMVEEQAIFTKGGIRIDTPVHTICHHGDEPTAVAVAKSVRRSIEDSGAFDLRPLPNMALN